MFNIGNYVVYKKDVCKIKNIKEKHFLDKDYYILSPIKDESLTIEVPTDNKSGLLRNIISKDEVERLINIMPDIKDITDVSDKLLEYQYKELIKTGNHEDLIKIIKTTYTRNNERTNNGKKENAKDHTYFKIAENLLYNEFSIALNLSYDDTKKYVIDKVTYLQNS